MAIRKPNGGAKAASTAPLTSVQDTRSRGNGNGNGNGERVLMSFKIPSDLKMMLQENARERGTTASRIIIDGIRHELGLDDYAAFVRVLDDFFRQGDIFLPGLGRSVDHYGGKSAVDGRLADFEIGAVVEVHDDGNICRFHSGLHEVAKIDGVGVLSRARGNLKNNGGLTFVRRLHDRLNHFHVVDVERADGIAARVRFLKHFGTVD